MFQSGLKKDKYGSTTKLGKSLDSFKVTKILNPGTVMGLNSAAVSMKDCVESEAV